MTPYRSPPKPERPAPPQTLECVIGDGDKYAWLRSLIVKLWIVAAVGYLLAMVSVLLFAPVAVLGAVWIWSDIARRKGKRVVLRTERDRVYVDLPAPIDIPLAKLLDVRLDTKTVSKALNQPRADGLNTIFGSAIPDGRTVDMDASRIELVIKGRREPVFLSEEYVSSTLAHENIRSVKVFLRKAGWLPLDERPLTDSPKRKKRPRAGE